MEIFLDEFGEEIKDGSSKYLNRSDRGFKNTKFKAGFGKKADACGKKFNNFNSGGIQVGESASFMGFKNDFLENGESDVINLSSKDTPKKPNKYKTEERAKTYAFHLLAKRDYLKDELKNKILSKNYSLKTAVEVVDYLERKGFLNDVRTSQNIIDYYKSQKGESWIRQKLMQKGLKNFDGLDFQYEDYSKIIRNTISRYRLKEIEEIDVNTRAKIYRFLAGRGYKNISELMEKIEEELRR